MFSNVATNITLPIIVSFTSMIFFWVLLGIILFNGVDNLRQKSQRKVFNCTYKKAVHVN